MAWQPGSAVVWRSVSDGVVRSVQAMRAVCDEPGLVALYLGPGNPGRRRKGRRGGPHGRQMLPDGWSGEYEETTWRTNRVLILHRPGDEYSVGLHWRASDGALAHWYVNLERPWRRTPIGFDTLDHVLDVVVKPDLSGWQWKDEDEFAFAQKIGAFTPTEAASIRAAGERAIAEIEQRSWPYRDGWERWTPDPSWTAPELYLQSGPYDGGRSEIG